MTPKRIRSPIALTLFLLSPIAVVAALCGWILISLRGDPDMRAEAVGQGARDTGGANALGEWLAGRDPDEIQRRNALIRAGDAVRPTTLETTLEIGVILPSGSSPSSVAVEFTVAGDVVHEIDLSSITGDLWTGDLDPSRVPGDARWRSVLDGQRGEIQPIPLLTPDEAAAERPRVVLLPAN